MNNKGHILVDLDGTLAQYDGWKGVEHIGEPIQTMLARVRSWVKQGIEVRIFTARACDPKSIPHIQKWCKFHVGKVLKVTNSKDYSTIEIWDDRAVAVQENTGKLFRWSDEE